MNKPRTAMSENRVAGTPTSKKGKTMKTKLLIAVLAMFSVPAFADECPAGTKAFGGPNSGFNMAGCANYAEGKRLFQGPFVVYWDNGAKQGEGQMLNGQRVGTWTFFDKAGVKTGTTEFKADQWDGQRVKFHANGQKESVEIYAAGKRTAAPVYFNQLGQQVGRDGVTLTAN